MQLIINATTVEELMEKVLSLANKFGVDLSESTKTPVTVAVVEAAKTIEVETEVEEAPKKERKKTAKKEEVIVEVVKTEKFETVTKAKSDLTKQDIADACQKVSEAHGLEKARSILAQFEGARRISDIKESDYASFIAACNEAL
jgi:hypothetical protein